MSKDALFVVESMEKPFSVERLVAMKKRVDAIRNVAPLLVAAVLLGCFVIVYFSYTSQSEYRDAMIMASGFATLLLPVNYPTLKGGAFNG